MIYSLVGSYLFGTVYGKFYGFLLTWLLVVLGAGFGGFLAFNVSRTFFYNVLKKQITKYKYLRAVDKSLASHGLKIICMLRIAPIIPYNVFNYTMAVTSVSGKDFFFGSFLGLVPHIAFFVYFSIQLSDLD